MPDSVGMIFMPQQTSGFQPELKPNGRISFWAVPFCCPGTVIPLAKEYPSVSAHDSTQP